MAKTFSGRKPCVSASEEKRCGFDLLKQQAVARLERDIKAGVADKPMLPVLRMINAHRDFFTSSSCFGRVMLIDFAGKKGVSKFVARWHRPVKFGEVKKSLNNTKNKRQVWFRMEPFIIHVSCRDLRAAEIILDVKNAAGIKRGGIFHIRHDRVQIELDGTQRTEALVKTGKKMLVGDAYLKRITEIANQRMKENEKDLHEFVRAFKKITKQRQ